LPMVAEISSAIILKQPESPGVPPQADATQEVHIPTTSPTRKTNIPPIHSPKQQWLPNNIKQTSPGRSTATAALPPVETPIRDDSATHKTPSTLAPPRNVVMPPAHTVMDECMVGWTNFTVTLQFSGTPLYCRAYYKTLCLKIGKDGIKIFTWCFKEPCGSFL
jgi:hypothetical protein